MVGVSKKHAKGRMDKYYHMAKEQGWRARSAFKLIQLNKKYNFLEKSKCLVDLCAAPGGWCQVAAKYMPKPNLIIGLDLAPIKPIPGVITHVEDITTQKCRVTLKKELKTWKADVVLHDGAPNVGTSWLQDAFTQAELVLSSLKLATEFLMPGGCFVTKIFRSKDYNKLMWVFNQLFAKVEATKPASSRNVSAEIFVVCREFKAPAKIDPRLLDPKYVFKEVDDTPEEEMDDKKKKERQGALLNDLFHPEKRRRHRSGYADGDYTLSITATVADFVQGPDFLTALTKSNALSFDQDDFGKQLAKHPLTTDEIKNCCSDLKVLGKKDFKDLLRWREAIRLDLGIEKKREEKVEEEVVEEEDDDETIGKKLDSAATAALSRARREKRKGREKKARQLLKLRLGMGTPTEIGLEASEVGGMGLEDGVDEGLFRLNGASVSRKTLTTTADQALEVYQLAESEDESAGDADTEDDDLEFDSDEEIERKIGNLETEMDGLFEQFQERRLERNPSARVRKQKEGAKAFEEWYGIEFENKRKRGSDEDTEDEQEDEDKELAEATRAAEDSGSAFSSSESESEVEVRPAKKKVAKKTTKKPSSEDEEEEAAPVTVDKSKLSLRARVFFDNPLFNELEAATTPKPTEPAAAAKKRKNIFEKERTNVNDWSDDTDDEDSVPKQTRKKGRKGRKGEEEDEDEKERKGFEIVPAGLDQQDINIDDFAITTAEAYTLAEQMVSKSGKRDLVDKSYNRYAFNDPDGVPEWFADDEGRHNKPTLPVTKEAVAIIKQRQRQLDARPIKKVAEAKFRKQMRTARRFEKMQKKADNVMGDDGGELTEKAKLQQVSKMLNKAKSKLPRKETKVVVARGLHRAQKGRPKGVKGRYKMVDPRMKKEMRAEKRSAKANKKKRR
ncbi:Spb1 C-terminal domain-containing protein [Phlyctochytrium arcticum]|nr:Spb1 C-terminal domain-containing protein [Phlyctochytrium arcticum]